MKQLRFVLIYLVSWVIFFQLSRAMFMVYHSASTKQLSFTTGFNTFRYGLRMDLSIAAYIALPVSIFVVLSLFISFFTKAILYKLYTPILLLFVLLVVAADLELYNHWHFRIDNTPLKYLSSPREAWASVSHLPIFWIIFFFLAIYILSIIVFTAIINSNIRFLQDRSSKTYRSFLVLLVFTFALILPIRGGWQLAPINQSSVYFSSNTFANHAAINAAWNFLHALMNKSSKKNPYSYLTPPEAKAVADSLYSVSGPTQYLIDSSRPNVIIIVWESLSEKLTKISVNGQEVTPKFNLLKKEGIYFSDIYASGDRTDKGLAAILSGYPALPKQSILRSPNKAAKLTSLPKEFAKHNYKTSFYYGGEPEFANIKSYLLNAGFQTIIDKNNFKKIDQNSKWGVHDGIVSKILFEELTHMKSPFFTTWLTLSSHEPFEIPLSPKFNGQDILSKLFSAHHYTDEVIFEFVEKSKKEEWWSNTLLIIIADHGHPIPETGSKTDDFKIPMLWLGGALKEEDYLVNSTGSQTDVATTLMQQLRFRSNFPFSKNLLDSGMKQWAFYSFNDGFGFVQPGKNLVFDNVGKRLLSSDKNIQPQDVRAGQALQQQFYADYINK